MAIISWEMFDKDVDSLIRTMGDYRPQILAPVLNGGMVPCAFISNKLDLYDVRPIGIERIGDKRRINYDIQGDIKDLDILIIEDSLKTGLGPIMAKKVFEERGAKVKIASVYITPNCADLIDFYGKIYDALADLPWKQTINRDRF